MPTDDMNYQLLMLVLTKTQDHRELLRFAKFLEDRSYRVLKGAPYRKMKQEIRDYWKNKRLL